MWVLIPKRIFIKTMMLSGAIGGIAGCIEVLGVHGYFLNNFATGLGTNGILASLIVKNNVVLAAIYVFFPCSIEIRSNGNAAKYGCAKINHRYNQCGIYYYSDNGINFSVSKKRKKAAEQKG